MRLLVFGFRLYSGREIERKKLRLILHVSLLRQYDAALTMYRKYYQYEEIRGSLRETVEKIPEEAHMNRLRFMILSFGSENDD